MEKVYRTLKFKILKRIVILSIDGLWLKRFAKHFEDLFMSTEG